MRVVALGEPKAWISEGAIPALQQAVSPATPLAIQATQDAVPVTTELMRSRTIPAKSVSGRGVADGAPPGATLAPQQNTFPEPAVTPQVRSIEALISEKTSGVPFNETGTALAT